MRTAKSWADFIKRPLRVVSEIKDFSETDAGTRILFRASSGAKDRDQESIDPLGWSWSESKLPNTLFGHDSHSPETWVGRGTDVRKDESGLYYETMLFDKSPAETADLARHLAWIGRMHIEALGSSVGFIPRRWRDPNGTIGTIDSPNGTYPWSIPGRRYLEQELVELSIVPVESNIEAAALAIRGLIDRAGRDPDAVGAFEIDSIEKLVSALLEATEPVSSLLAKAKTLLPPPGEEFDPEWLKFGIKSPLLRPSRKAGAPLSREEFERLSNAKDALAAFLATAVAAEEPAA